MKHLKRILSALLIALTFLIFTGCDGFSVSFSGCQDFDFSFLEGCTSFFPEEDEDDGEFIQTSVYAFELIENEDSFYYPLVKGEMHLQRVPDEIIFTFDDKEFLIEPNSMSYDADNVVYSIKFEQAVEPFGVRKGKHETAIKYIYDQKTVTVTEKIVTIDDNYFLANAVNSDTGETITLLDKESNWIGPF